MVSEAADGWDGELELQLNARGEASVSQPAEYYINVACLL